jgi:Ca2+/Na+ antiporter
LEDRKGKKQNQILPKRPNIWGFMQNVLISAMHRGQLIPISVFLIIFIGFLKMDSEDIFKIFINVFSFNVFNTSFAYTLLVLCIIVFYKVVKYQRRIHTEEIKRISDEKKELQSKLLDRKLPSSNDSLK